MGSSTFYRHQGRYYHPATDEWFKQVPQATHAINGSRTDVNIFQATVKEGICGESQAEENISINETDLQGNENDSAGQ